MLPDSTGWGTDFATPYNRHFTSVGPVEKSMHDAALAGWVEETPVGYDGGYKTVRDDGSDDTSLRPWYGYWIKANQPGLTLELPAYAEPTTAASDVVSAATLVVDAPDCITSNFTAGLATSADDGYEATRDVSFPPAGPADAKEIAFSTDFGGTAMLQDFRPPPPTGNTKVWSGHFEGVNLVAAECKTVAVTWNTTGSGYKYELIDVNASVTTPMKPGDSYSFQICQGESLPFEIRVSEAFSKVDYNQDGYVDAIDLTHFEDCATGPAIGGATQACLDDVDLDGDGDIDEADFGIFQTCISGGEPANVYCP